MPIEPTDVAGIVDWCRKVRPDLAIIGPCHPLRFGVVDALSSEGIRAVGPTALGATLESSKGWAAELARSAGVPMAATYAFDAPHVADAFVTQQGRPFVVKPDGEAFAAAVTVSDSVEDTLAAIDRVSRNWWTYGATDGRIVLQERAHGLELQVTSLTDGTTARVLHACRGYKRPQDGDQGAFTSGMGTYAPVAPEWTPGLRADLEARILTPLLAEMRRRGIAYSGFIEAGVMLTADGPVVLEFNCRLGNPSTNAILPLLRFDLVEAMEAAIVGELEAVEIPEPVGAAVCVMLRRRKRTEPADRGFAVVVEGLESADEGALVFHSRTAQDDGRWLFEPRATLGVTGLGDTLPEARERAYAAVGRIHFEGAYRRTDIAAEAAGVGWPVDTAVAQVRADR